MRQSDQEVVERTISQPAEDYANLFLCLRFELGVSQTHLAGLVGTSQGSWCKYESGLLPPSVDIFLAAFRLALDTDVSRTRFVRFAAGRPARIALYSPG